MLFLFFFRGESTRSTFRRNNIQRKKGKKKKFLFLLFLFTCFILIFLSIFSFSFPFLLLCLFFFTEENPQDLPFVLKIIFKGKKKEIAISKQNYSFGDLLKEFCPSSQNSETLECQTSGITWPNSAIIVSNMKKIKSQTVTFAGKDWEEKREK